MKILATKVELVTLIKERIDAKRSLRDYYPKRSKQYAFLNGVVEGMTTIALMIEQCTLQKASKEI